MQSNNTLKQQELSWGIPFRLGISAASAALVGAGIAAVSPGQWGTGWLASTLLLSICFYILIAAWQWAGSSRILGWMVALAFFLRLGLGVGLSLALPVWGSPGEPVQQAGYLFPDAYERDHRAWELAQSGLPLWVSFRDELATDQYGGLLALSAGVYRFISPDAHRPFLILILGAFTSALGVIFLRQAVCLHWPTRVANIAAWIYVLYPDALFFASSPMREPFLVGLSAVAFWAVLSWGRSYRAALLAGIPSVAVMALISSRVAAAVVGFLGLLFLLEYVISRPERRWKILGWVGLSVGLLLLLAFSWDWFQSSAAWDISVTQRTSGWVEYALENASKRTGIAIETLRSPFVVAYGLARPVLPAAVAETAIPFWKTVGIVRSAGWYALAPFLLYSLFAFWKERDPRKRWRLIWLALTVVLWLVIASARGGGDGNDNPRYRSLFIVWLALLAGWAVDWALVHRDAWLWRWLAVEAIFLGFFTNWYFSRYFRIWGRMDFWQMTIWIVALSGLVLVGGWIWDRWRQRSARSR